MVIMIIIMKQIPCSFMRDRDFRRTGKYVFSSLVIFFLNWHTTDLEHVYDGRNTCMKNNKMVPGRSRDHFFEEKKNRRYVPDIDLTHHDLALSIIEIFGEQIYIRESK